MKNHFLLSLFLMVSTFVLKAQDTTAPVLHNIYVSPDTVHAGDSITVFMDLTDDISGPLFINTPGFSGGSVTDVSLNSNMAVANNISSGTWFLTSGNVYYTKILIPNNAVTGNWLIIGLQTCDRAGNVGEYYSSDINVQFVVLPSLTYVSNDTISPAIYAVTFDTSTVHSDSIITAYIDAYDSSGILTVGVELENINFPSMIASPIAPYYSFNGSLYVQRYHIPRWGVGGQWHISKAYAEDSIHNYGEKSPSTFLCDSFNVIASSPDTINPTINSYNISPSFAHRGDTITLTIEVEDTLSGLDNWYGLTATIANNLYTQQQQNFPSFTNLGGGNYVVKLKLSEYAANGVWHTYIRAEDNAGNEMFINVDTAFIVEPDSIIIIQGNVQQNNNTPLANSKVYMVKESPTDSLIYVMRVTNTDINGDYIFYSERRDSLVYLKAIPGTSITGELPTYLDSSVLFTGARLLHIDTTLVHTIDTIHTIAGTNSGGFGFIIGYVSQGAGKVDAVGDPEMQLGLLLVDDQGKFVEGAITDSTGHFKFSNLADGTYSVYTDLPKINNGIAPTLTIDAQHRNLNNLQFALHERYLERVIDGIDELNDGSIAVAPNPSNGMFTLTLNDGIVGAITVYNELGEKVLQQNSNTAKNLQRQMIDLSANATGIYLLRLTTSQGVKTVKLVKK